jgi:hypothetical protein
MLAALMVKTESRAARQKRTRDGAEKCIRVWFYVIPRFIYPPVDVGEEMQCKYTAEFGMSIEVLFCDVPHPVLSHAPRGERVPEHIDFLCLCSLPWLLLPLGEGGG